jgi:hypothetical protein
MEAVELQLEGMALACDCGCILHCLPGREEARQGSQRTILKGRICGGRICCQGVEAVELKLEGIAWACDLRCILHCLPGREEPTHHNKWQRTTLWHARPTGAGSNGISAPCRCRASARVSAPQDPKDKVIGASFRGRFYRC